MDKYRWPRLVAWNGKSYSIHHSSEQPLLAGSSRDAKTIYFDRGWNPTAEVEDTAGKRRMMDRLLPVVVHEVKENEAETKLGKPYLTAHHQYAEPSEKQVVQSMGFNWQSYQDSFKGEIKRCAKESKAHLPHNEEPYLNMRKRKRN